MSYYDDIDPIGENLNDNECCYCGEPCVGSYCNKECNNADYNENCKD